MIQLPENDDQKQLDRLSWYIAACYASLILMFVFIVASL